MRTTWAFAHCYEIISLPLFQLLLSFGSEMPKIYLKDVILHGKTFCCCLPVRLAFNCPCIPTHSSSTLRFGLVWFPCRYDLFNLFHVSIWWTKFSFLVSYLEDCFRYYYGLRSLVCWLALISFQRTHFSTDTSSTMDPTERTAFIIAGLVETLLLVASVLGWVFTISSIISLLTLPQVRRRSCSQTAFYSNLRLLHICPLCRQRRCCGLLSLCHHALFFNGYNESMRWHCHELWRTESVYRCLFGLDNYNYSDSCDCAIDRALCATVLPYYWWLIADSSLSL